LKPDSDGDGIPDYCDPVFNQGNKDSDNDGLPDVRDAHPYSSDYDQDGMEDGYDSDPDVNAHAQE
jgi:hypothetical protein